MSEVKKISPVGNIYGWEESQFGEFVLSQDYDALADETQALREEIARSEQHRNDQADLIVSLRTEVSALRITRDDFKLERDLARKNFCDEQAANYQLQAHLNTCLDELSALRARVVVLPDASTVYAALDARERLFTSPENIQVALEAQSRLHGKTVSEGLLRRIVEEQPAVQDIGEMFNWQYARDQAMAELRALLNQDKENGNG
ncbi:TPA: hypothetical protein SL808_001389 [Pseudomonas aeruginosa]|nr:hypothetical protein [Pseudomonas aeruginosa]